MDLKEQEDVGKTALYKNLDDEKYELFMKLISFDNTEFLSIIDIMAGRNTLLMLLDTFAGESIKFPNRKSVIWALEKVHMYMYLKERNFSQEAYHTVSKMYDRSVYEIKKIVKVIDKNLANKK